MERAEIETPFSFPGYEDVKAGIVKWPMSVVRISCPDSARLIDLADKILGKWRAYTDEAAAIYAETEGVPHNTITPIARMRGGVPELDLVLRNNLTTLEHPPRPLPPPRRASTTSRRRTSASSRSWASPCCPPVLKTELAAVADCLVSGADLRAGELTAKHATGPKASAAGTISRRRTPLTIVKHETGLVFAQVLEHAGVYKRSQEGPQRLHTLPRNRLTPTHGQCRPGRRGPLRRIRRISGETNQHRIKIARNSAEFRAFFPGLRLGKNTSRAESVKKIHQCGTLVDFLCANEAPVSIAPPARGTLIGTKCPQAFRPA